MLSHFRLLRPCLRPFPSSSSLPAARSISSSTPTASDLAPEPPSPEEEAALKATEEATEEAPKEPDPFENQDDSKGPKSFRHFLKTIGEPFEVPKPRNWLGGTVPFPMNQSFQPPPPVSDLQRTQMYNAYMKDPSPSTIRRLSQEYHISLKRVDAILRLKGMEAAWKKGKQLQTGFQHGMETILGVRQRVWNGEKNDIARYDVHEADELELDENRDFARQRYQRMYWESTPEDGREPITPGSLQHAKVLAKRSATAAERMKGNAYLMPRVKDTTKIKRPSAEVVSEKPGRPTMVFQDVGAKFMDVNDRLTRMAGSERRMRRKAKQQLSR